MSGLTIDNFSDFFQALHGHPPYPWQCRLAERAIAGDWPGAIDLPTGSGKTACLDIAIYAMACQASLPVGQRTAPRRIFFCVNRRVIVDEAHTRARRIAETIWKSEQNKATRKPILAAVAFALRTIANTSSNNGVPPLDVVELRGGIYRDSRWARSITQPTIICTTLDQLGSRMLFRGYGVSANAAPIQAALIAYDSLVLLDEAHISEPFRQTLNHVQCYLDPQKWAKQPIGARPVQVVPMTATPNDKMATQGVIQLDNADRMNEQLLARLSANKPAELRNVKSVTEDAVSITRSLDSDEPVTVGIIVNRIATAKDVYNSLCDLRQQAKVQSKAKKRQIAPDAIIELVIGSMRPIDRDDQAERLRTIVGSGRPMITTQTSFVIATQCLEVGADYDFDVLITECASLDALRQRFGRLNRAGRVIKAKSFILANKKDIKPDDKLDETKPLDPIYGNALARTWNWLATHLIDGHIDFGIDALSETLASHGEKGRPPQNLLAPSASLNAPVMVPAYLDLWCQTAPKPTPDPNVSLFIHGSQRSEPDVQVCWRADLDDTYLTHDQWCDIVALLPPTSSECMSVSISRTRRWLANQMESTRDDGDVLGIGEADQSNPHGGNSEHPELLRHHGVLWRGAKDSMLIRGPGDLRPGDTLVLPASNGNSRSLGHVLDANHAGATAADDSNDQQALSISDVAETAFTRARDLAALRLHPSIRSRLPVGGAFDGLFTAAAERNEPPNRKEWKEKLKTAAAAIQDDNNPLKRSLMQLAGNGIQIEPYPDDRGLVLTTRRRLNTSTNWFIRPMDEGDDESSRIHHNMPVVLADHRTHVADVTGQSIVSLPIGSFAEAFELAAELHDLGKADERFQAMLRRTDRTDAWLLAGVTSSVLAKSDGMPMTRAQRNDARLRSGLPAGFRHEMLSAQLAELSGLLPKDSATRDLILHLIAAHHGHSRPFAPVVPDDELPPVEVENITLSHEQRAELIPACRLDSGIAERFWSLTRKFGWWGLAYLEAVHRLADQQASAAEEAGKYDNAPRPMEVTT